MDDSSHQKAGWAKKKNDSPRGSRSGGTGETAEGRIRGLKERKEISRLSLMDCQSIDEDKGKILTTSVLVDFGGVDERHGGDRQTKTK